MAEESNLGSYARRARERTGLSIRAAAKAADVDATWLSRLEQDRYQKPDARLLSRLADALDIRAADLYRLAGYTNPSAPLPHFNGYLRARYDLPEEAITQLQAHFDLINDKYRSRKGGTHDDDLERATRPRTP